MHPSVRKWLFAGLAVLLIGAAATRVAPLNELRQQNQLILDKLPEDVLAANLATPLLAVGRAVLADIYWIVATRSKDEGRFFDAYQLAKRICDLQPRFASVWAFQAWNMSYNISVTLKTPEERWRWVRNGYELLRDKGIPFNPHNTQLYKELAWIFFHKIGDSMDDCHNYYKLQLALQMEDILGEPPVNYARPGRLRDDYYREYDFQSLANAPLTITELQNDADVAGFVLRLKEFGFDATESGIFLGLLTALRDGTVEVPNPAPGQGETRLHELKALMIDPKTQSARTAIEHFWRAYRLRHEVKLDPKQILTLQSGYKIDFDWRLPHTQALYWASLGMERGNLTQEAVDIQKLNTNRIEFYCIQKMFQQGHMTMSRNARLGEQPLLLPDYRMIPILRTAFENDSKEYLKREYVNKPVSENFLTGYIGFMRAAIIRYSEVGKQKEAQELFDVLREHFPDPMYTKGLDGFLAEQFRIELENVSDYRRSLAKILGLLNNGLMLLAYDEDEEAGRYMLRAKKVYDYYQAVIVSERLKIQAPYTEILESCAHGVGGGMYRATYERLCEKLGIKPLPAEGNPSNAPGNSNLAPPQLP